ncbi:type I polyketide synthase [Allokutzneria sp. NRRL B-24872]|uniref:type I polyketide synthase n=1 Tax=Allokutzneria sp. NRRL B-24872 TaxID=1137961 RepID=UPI000A3835D3|nr:type I polyketide synthase [Allokutzneria sp. NRRL B-24872]
MSDEQGFEGDIAVVGLAGRFPGADDAAGFWANLVAGRSGIVKHSKQELVAAGVSAEHANDPRYVPVSAGVSGMDGFDAGFFGVDPEEAALMDPQHRVFLETVWHALEDAAINPSTVDGTVAVYAGCGPSTYLMVNLMAHEDLFVKVGPEHLILLNDKDTLAGRVSYSLDLTGPAVTVQAHSATSLVAVCTACTSLAAGETDVAVAGGVSLLVQPPGYWYSEANRLSSDGVVRPFDADANGKITGDGAGAVVLRRLEDALADGDRVYAVIRGWAVNNDGADKAGFTAPSVQGQAAVMAEALGAAGVEPEEVDFVETNASGTVFGDAAEVAAIQQVFAESARLKIGSAKSGIGHLNQAAGIASLIKTVLALHHEELPGTLNFTAPNKQLARTGDRIQVPVEPSTWARGERTRFAGVNSFGFGGTNAHVVLEEAPEPEDEPNPRAHSLLVWSGTSAEAADALTERIAASTEPVEDLAYTLQIGRRAFGHRRAAVVKSTVDIHEDGRTLAASNVIEGREVGFLIAGVGEQYKGMVGDLYRDEPVFREAIDECSAIFREHLGTEPIADMIAERGAASNDLARLLGRTEETETAATDVVQPAVFAVEYALGKLLLDWGITPSVLAGYSVGEFVAAALSESLTLTEAASLVAVRAKLIAKLPQGAMVAVPLSVADLTAKVGPLDDIDVAAVNGPAMTVLSGPAEKLGAITDAVPARYLRTTHAFHSRALRPVAAELTAWARQNLDPQAPKIPYLSNVTGAPITERQLKDPGYWAEHMCRTVQFADMVAHLAAEHPDAALVELGAGQSLGAMFRGHPDVPSSRWSLLVSTLPGDSDPNETQFVLTEALGKVWLTGADVDWAAYHRGRGARKTTAPVHAFERRRHWIDPQERGENR